MRPKRPLIMGVLNVTPDSFSDGGKFVHPDRALEQAAQMIDQGADIIDVGGESSRPGAKEIDVHIENDRVQPIIELLQHHFKDITLSVDTRHAYVARQAVLSGATIINDISAGADAQMLEVLTEFPHTTYALMHMRGTPETMQQDINYPRGVVRDVFEFLNQKVAWLTEQKIERERLWIDPGIGFGKTFEDNVQLLAHLDYFKQLHLPILIGTSRKSFLTQFIHGENKGIEKRGPATLATHLWALYKGASVFRVHDVEAWNSAMSAFGCLLQRSQERVE